MTRMTISIQGGRIAVADTGKSGGHARARSGRRMVWIRDPATVASFSLKFERLEEGEGALASSIDWPFATTKAVPAAAKIDEVDCEVKDAEKLVGRLGADPGIFKYTVEVTPVPPNPPAPALDPIIIIER
jgi:hypothetical protein